MVKNEIFLQLGQKGPQENISFNYVEYLEKNSEKLNKTKEVHFSQTTKTV